MKRLLTFATVSAVSALTLAGGASAATIRMADQQQALCALLELAPGTSCAELEAGFRGEHTVAAILDASVETTGRVAVDRPVPQSLTQ